ncbi:MULTISPECIES: hypothetical protein [Dietzia]|uniref:hypothetical protein n=1 Tax=Dietzia TaxID=37914 RepID=UPI000A68021A|nr:hypothetical protein [Dietzia papillomatosis]MCT2058670.1 hypothetical protein [Dietzia cinnamea]
MMGSLSTGMDTAVPSRMVEVTAAAAPSATHGERRGVWPPVAREQRQAEFHAHSPVCVATRADT